ncbi:hypothetical protein [Stieleria neptunia]|uniref:hypothetical protein n=1 Tax=Stieleria neptunia TaxID=2527979 RepID=UPI0018D25AFA|nr:hypothetical protein [Stieleria neptunia]
MAEEKLGHYAGRLEGHELTDRQYRLFLSCPDAGVLASKLQPWIEQVDWAGRVGMTVRQGRFDDPDASEERYSIE